MAHSGALLRITVHTSAHHLTFVSIQCFDLIIREFATRSFIISSNNLIL